MCRILGYLGEPIDLEHILFETDSSLVRQSYSPRMMAGFLNLAGFGMAAWDPRSVQSDAPFTYRVTTLPTFDRWRANVDQLVAAGIPVFTAMTEEPWRYLELATGHWPMLSAPAELASVLHELASEP